MTRPGPTTADALRLFVALFAAAVLLGLFLERVG